MKITRTTAAERVGSVALITALTSLLYQSALGQSKLELEEIVVEATRVKAPLGKIPYAVGVVEEAEIQSGQQQLSLGESVSRIPGVFLQNPYNYAQDLRISIRGFGARVNFGIRGIKILVDGIPNTLPDGQGEVDSIDLGTAGQIDVLRGAASSLYGNASGGLISVITERAPERKFADLRAAGGDFGYWKYQAKTGGRTARFEYLLGAGDLKMEGYRDHSRVENKNFNSKFTFEIDATSELSAVVNSFDSPVAQDPGSLNAEQAAADPTQANPRNVQFDAGEAINQQKVGLRYHKDFSGAHGFTARAYGTQRDFENRLPFQSSGAVQLDRVFYGGGLQYVYTDKLGHMNNRLLLGIDLDVQDDDRMRFDNNDGFRGDLTFDQNETVSSIGVFMQNALNLNDRITLTLGGRLDSIDFEVVDHFLFDGDDSGERTFEEFSPMLGVVFDANDSMNLYANLSTAFETPTTTELASPSGGGGFNPDLKPQTATSYELGIRGLLAGGATLYELTVFRANVEDEITPFELPEFPGRTFFRNAGKSTRNGIEATVTVEPIVGFTLSLAYTYSDFKFDEFTVDGEDFAGNRIPGIPKNLFHAALEYRREGSFAIADFINVGEMFADNANSTEVQPYTVVDLRAGYEKIVGDWTLTPFVGVNNLFNERYNGNIRINAFGGRYFEPAPNRNLYGGLTVRKSFGT